MQGEHSIQVAHLENATNPGLRTHHHQVTGVRPEPPKGTDHHAEPHGVHEVNRRQVQDHQPGAAGDLGYHGLTKTGSSGHVEVTQNGQHHSGWDTGGIGRTQVTAEDVELHLSEFPPCGRSGPVRHRR